jgi:hypothetical protein
VPGQKTAHVIADADNMRYRNEIGFEDSEKLRPGIVNDYGARAGWLKLLDGLQWQMKQDFFSEQKCSLRDGLPKWRMWKDRTRYRTVQCSSALSGLQCVSEVIDN